MSCCGGKDADKAGNVTNPGVDIDQGIVKGMDEDEFRLRQQKANQKEFSA